MSDYYELLGVSRQASEDEIKKAYRKKAAAHHPDRNQGDHNAEELFKQCSQAYAVLSDADKRRRYDQLGHERFAASGAHADSMDFGSMGSVLDGLFGEILRGFRPQETKADDLELDLTVGFEAAALGSQQSLRLKRLNRCKGCDGSGARPGTSVHTCTTCQGRGQVQVQRGFFVTTKACATCQGRGKRIDTFCGECKGNMFTLEETSIDVVIPAGVEEGAVRTLSGMGHQGPGLPGDLHLTIRVKAHPLFTRKGPDVMCQIPVSFPQAVLGTTLDVPTLQGKVQMRLPAGTPSGKTFRIRGKGIAVFGGYGKGDQLVQVEIEVPESLTTRQRELVEALAAEFEKDVPSRRQTFLDKLRGLFE